MYTVPTATNWMQVHTICQVDSSYLRYLTEPKAIRRSFRRLEPRPSRDGGRLSARLTYFGPTAFSARVRRLAVSPVTRQNPPNDNINLNPLQCMRPLIATSWKITLGLGKPDRPAISRRRSSALLLSSVPILRQVAVLILCG